MSREAERGGITEACPARGAAFGRASDRSWSDMGASSLPIEMLIENRHKRLYSLYVPA